MLLNEPLYRLQSASAETIILRQFDSWFYPELRFTLGRVHVNMHARFLAGEEKNRYGPLRNTVGLVPHLTVRKAGA